MCPFPPAPCPQAKQAPPQAPSAASLAEPAVVNPLGVISAGYAN